MKRILILIAMSLVFFSVGCDNDEKNTVEVSVCTEAGNECVNNTNGKTVCVEDKCVEPAADAETCTDDGNECVNNTNGKTACVDDKCVEPANNAETCTDDGNECVNNTNGKTACVDDKCVEPANNAETCTDDGNECVNNTNGKTACVDDKCVEPANNAETCTDDGNECVNNTNGKTACYSDYGKYDCDFPQCDPHSFTDPTSVICNTARDKVYSYLLNEIDKCYELVTTDCGANGEVCIDDELNSNPIPHCSADTNVIDCTEGENECVNNTNGKTECVDDKCVEPANNAETCTDDGNECVNNTNGKTACYSDYGKYDCDFPQCDPHSFTDPTSVICNTARDKVYSYLLNEIDKCYELVTTDCGANGEVCIDDELNSNPIPHCSADTNVIDCTEGENECVNNTNDKVICVNEKCGYRACAENGCTKTECSSDGTTVNLCILKESENCYYVSEDIKVVCTGENNACSGDGDNTNCKIDVSVTECSEFGGECRYNLNGKTECSEMLEIRGCTYPSCETDGCYKSRCDGDVMNTCVEDDANKCLKVVATDCSATSQTCVADDGVAPTCE